VWDHGVKPKDAIHAATALEANIPIIEISNIHL
jgi:predicted nucleic acid-binding protein